MMKNAYLILVIIAALFSACKKDETTPETLTGSWELRQTLGGYTAVGELPVYKQGNGNIIEFTANEYKQISGGKTRAQGTYKVVEESAEIDGTKYSSRLVFDNSDLKVYFRISGKQLLICMGSIAHDGTTNTYEKIEPLRCGTVL